MNAARSDNNKLSVNDFIVKASALALKAVPEVNSSWQGNFIRRYTTLSNGRYHDVDICIATATPTGLITPIVTNVEKKGIATISSEIKQLAMRARNNELKPHEYQGGTFTISNMGMYGVEQFTAIINLPQCAILAVGTVRSQLVAKEEGKYGQEQRMKVTLSCDHRVVDGAVGAQWLQSWRGYIENPLTLML